MPIIVTSAKGGSGATVVAASIALANAASTLVDLTGDATASFGVPTEAGPGVADWLRSGAPPARLDECMLAERPRLLPWEGAAHVSPGDVERGRWQQLLEWAARRELLDGAPVVIDAGPFTVELRHAATGADVRLTVVVVTRPCYLALRRSAGPRADLVVLVTEPGRSLGERDVERSLGAPVAAALAWDPAIARAVDAGLSNVAVPRPMLRCGNRVLTAIDRAWARGVAA